MAKLGSATRGQILDEKENYHTYCKNQISRGLEQIQLFMHNTNKFTFDIYR